jgi:hypothetical protein
MKRVLLMMGIASLFSASVAPAQTLREVAAAPAGAHDAKAASPASGATVMSMFDRSIVKGFNEAWQRTAAGTALLEAVVLVVRNPDGSYKAVLPKTTREYRQFTFRWQPGTVAVVHTHPNHSDPKPQPADIEIAERFQVLMFTLTLRGMFLYDPATKVISKVQEGIDWLDYSKWKRYATATASQLASR